MMILSCTGKRKAVAPPVIEQDPNCINKLPMDVLMHSFYLLARDDFKSTKNCALVCKRWNAALKSPIIRQLFVQRLYSHLMVMNDDIEPRYYTEAVDYARRLNQLSFSFANSEKSLLAYPSYLRKLKQALDQREGFFASLPYFDLRPFGWLQAKDWQKLFAEVAPRLKNVRVLQISGIGGSIDFYKLQLLHVPVLGEAFKVSKTIMEEMQDIFGYKDSSKHQTEIANRLCMCVGLIASVSKQLTTLIADDTGLNGQQIRAILKTFNTISKAHVTGRKLSWHELSAFKTEFPLVEFSKPK